MLDKCFVETLEKSREQIKKSSFPISSDTEMLEIARERLIILLTGKTEIEVKAFYQGLNLAGILITDASNIVSYLAVCYVFLDIYLEMFK